MKSLIKEKTERFVRERKIYRRWLAGLMCLVLLVSSCTYTVLTRSGLASDENPEDVIATYAEEDEPEVPEEPEVTEEPAEPEVPEEPADAPTEPAVDVEEPAADQTTDTEPIELTDPETVLEETVTDVEPTDEEEADPEILVPAEQEPQEELEAQAEIEEETPEVEILSSEMTLEAELDGTKITAEIPAGAFKAYQAEVDEEELDESRVSMEAVEFGGDDEEYADVSDLIKEGLADETYMDDMRLYRVTFTVDDEEQEPQEVITLTVEGSGLELDSVEKAAVFSYDAEDESISEIPQRELLAKELEEAGEDTSNLDEEYDTSYLTLEEEEDTVKAAEVGMEVREASGIYGVYTMGTYTLVYEDEEVVVKVGAVEEGAIPEGASLNVTPIKGEGETKKEYAAVENKLQNKAEGEAYDIAGFLAYDICLVDGDGEKEEPDGRVKVTMSYKKAAIPEATAEAVAASEETGSVSKFNDARETENEKGVTYYLEEVAFSAEYNVTVMHLSGETVDGKSDVDNMGEGNDIKTLQVTEDMEIEKVEFVTESFSIYTITWTAVSTLDDAQKYIIGFEPSTNSNSSVSTFYAYNGTVTPISIEKVNINGMGMGSTTTTTTTAVLEGSAVWKYSQGSSTFTNETGISVSGSVNNYSSTWKIKNETSSDDYAENSGSAASANSNSYLYCSKNSESGYSYSYTNYNNASSLKIYKITEGSGGNEKFYWRFRNESKTGTDISTGAVNSYKEYVTVSYTPAPGETTESVPYNTYQDAMNKTVRDTNVNKAYINVSQNVPSDGTFHIKTSDGWVVTSYVIACEMNDQTGENCHTSNVTNLTVNLNTSGKYNTDLTVTVAKIEEKLGTEGDVFHHTSNASQYALILTIAQVNVNIDLEKSVDKETCIEGETLKYTLEAVNKNKNNVALNDVVITDAFLKNASITSVVRGETSLSSVDKSNLLANGKYYYNKTDGTITIGGSWATGEENKIVVIYTYETDNKVGTLTNTAYIIGTPNGGSSSIQDMAIAQVVVTVNSANTGSLVVYKDFGGLLPSEVDNVMKNFSITVTAQTSGNSEYSIVFTKAAHEENGTFPNTLYSGKKNISEKLVLISATPSSLTYRYYAVISGIDKDTSWTVSESSYGLDGYTVTTNVSAVMTTINTSSDMSNGEDREKTEDLSVSGSEYDGTYTTTAVKVAGASTTFVTLKNDYTDNHSYIKIVKKWMDGKSEVDSPKNGEGEDISTLSVEVQYPQDAEETGETDSTTMAETGDSGEATGNRASVTLSSSNGWTSGLLTYNVPWGNGDGWTITETDLPSNWHRSEDESGWNEGTENVTIKETIENADGETEEVDKTVTCHVYTLVNRIDVSLDLKKVSATDDSKSLTGAKFSLEKMSDDGTTWTEYNEEFEVSDEVTELKNLPSGSYRLREVVAPTGYSVLSGYIYFKIENGEVELIDGNGTELSEDTEKQYSLDKSGLILTIEDEVIYNLPEAGGMGIYWYTFSGMLLMMAGALILYKKRREGVL